MSKNKEIVALQKKQKAIKREISYLKKKLPTFIVGFILFTFVSLYFLEDKFYKFFGNGVKAIIGVVILSGCFCLFLIYRNYRKIKTKTAASKNIGIQLYNIMKLEDTPVNE